MKTLKTMLLVLTVAIPAATARAQTAVTGYNTVGCPSRSTIQTVREGMNKEQLASLGCAQMPGGVKVDILPPTSPDDMYMLVAATTPTEVIRFWVRTVYMTTIRP